LDLRPDHEVSIGRGDHTVLKFNEIDDWVHAQTLSSRPNRVNRKL